jgi:hypothetical protein
MFSIHSVSGRIAVGKLTGFLVGVTGFLLLPQFLADITLEFRLGFLLLMITMGAMIGFVGIYTRHPVFSALAIPWWLRGSAVGLLFFLIFVLFAKDQLAPLMSLDIIILSGLESPYWILIDGMLIGGLIEYITTKICGEGNLPIT